MRTHKESQAYSAGIKIYAELGRAFYESKAAHATSPWTTWDRLHQWERYRERITAAHEVLQRWACDHPDVNDWPAELPPVRWERGRPVFDEPRG